MQTETTIIAKRSPETNAFLFLFLAGGLLIFSITSIHSGFDTTEHPWMERRLWMWWLTAWVLSPGLIAAYAIQIWQLAKTRFVALYARDERIHLVSIKPQSFALGDLVAVIVKHGTLTFCLREGREATVALGGLVGGMDDVVERLKALKPDIQIR